MSEDEEDMFGMTYNEEGVDQDSPFSVEKHDIDNIRSVVVDLAEILEDQLGETAYISAVNYRELQNLLPKKINGVSPTVTDGQTIGTGGGFSKVRGEYEDEEQIVTVTIIDLAAFGMHAASSLSDWLGEEIDRESDRGFERTHIFRDQTKEYPTFEKYSNDHGLESCEMHSWVADRFLIAISGNGVSMETCESARDRISFRRLERFAESVSD